MWRNSPHALRCRLGRTLPTTSSADNIQDGTSLGHTLLAKMPAAKQAPVTKPPRHRPGITLFRGSVRKQIPSSGHWPGPFAPGRHKREQAGGISPELTCFRSHYTLSPRPAIGVDSAVGHVNPLSHLPATSSHARSNGFAMPLRHDDGDRVTVWIFNSS